MENESVNDARGALAAVDGARAKAAARLISPWWYHPVLGVLAAGFVVAYTLGTTATMISVAVVYFVGLGILVGSYKAKTGLWINGLKAGKASRWTVPLMATMVLCIGVAYYLHAERGLQWPAWVAGGIVFAAVNVFGRLFDVTLRKQLRERP